jgi:ketosteroid isomerase-like protein
VKKRIVVPLVGLAISFALSSYAQQKDSADPQTTQKILAICKAIDDAVNNNDPAARAAPFTRDAVMVTPDGQPLIGRQPIQKWFTDLYQWWHPENHIEKLEGIPFTRYVRLATICGQPEIGARLGKARTANPSQSRAVGQ